MSMNMDFVRKQFPGLNGEWVLFENAGGSQILRQTADRIRDYLFNTNVQLGASYEISRESTKRVNMGIRAMAELIHAKKESEIILGSSTSMLLRNLSTSLSQYFKPGDEIIVTNCDHEANIGPWRNLEKFGMIIKEWQINPETLELDIEDLKKLLSSKTRLLAMTHASNILGTINPIKKIASLVHEHGAWICVDGVAYMPHRLADMQDLDVDFYAFSFYKVYGPHYALLYAKHTIIEKLPGINHFFLENEIPYKLQPGNVNYELTYGLTGLLDYFHEFVSIHTNEAKKSTLDAARFAYDVIASHEEELSTRFLEFLNSKKNIRVIGKTIPDRQARVPTFSFIVDGKKSSEIPPHVEKHKIAIRYGDFYAYRLIRDLGFAPLDGVVRVSMVHYNTIDEVDKLIKILSPII